MDIVFKEYEEKDFDDLKEMIVCLYDEDPEGEPITEAKIRKTVRESTAHPEKIRIVMICADGINIGYGILVFYWSNEHGGNVVNIDELFIKKEYRNKKVASTFIEHLKTVYENTVALQLETMPSNIAAARLYKRLGFAVSPNCHMRLRLHSKP